MDVIDLVSPPQEYNFPNFMIFIRYPIEKCQQIEAETKCPPFRRLHSPEWTLLNWNHNLWSLGSNRQ